MTASLAGKFALVTGASRGIGREIALALAAEGATVCAHYGARADGAAETVRAIEAAGGHAFALGADLGDMAAIDLLFAELDSRGQANIDILVNNAGVGTMASLAETDEALYDSMFAVNLKGLFFLTRRAIERMRDGGRIVNISSMVSQAAYPACVAYAMTKAGVNCFTTAMAAELGPRRITVNAVAPGATATEFLGPLAEDPTIMEALGKAAALGRVGAADDIAKVVAFLASPAGGWITGQVIQASGGMHL